jgi:hypothetical protein
MCADGGSCSLGTDPASLTYTRCLDLIDSFCSSNPSDPGCSSRSFPNRLGCDYANVVGSPCYTAGNPCQALDGAMSSACHSYVEQYCANANASNAAVDQGCVHSPLPAAGSSMDYPCSFSHSIPGSPCYIAESQPCTGPGAAGTAKCQAQVQAYCFVRPDGAPPGAAHVLRTDDPGCSSHQWWYLYAACPFKDTAGSPCYTETGPCLKSHCVLRMSKDATVVVPDDSSTYWAHCDSMTNLASARVATGISEGDTATCQSAIDIYCNTTNPNDPHCANVNEGCGPTQSVCPFRPVPGSPCCNTGSNPCISDINDGEDLQTQATACATLTAEYCWPPELQAVFQILDDPGCNVGSFSFEYPKA